MNKEEQALIARLEALYSKHTNISDTALDIMRLIEMAQDMDETLSSRKAGCVTINKIRAIITEYNNYRGTDGQGMHGDCLRKIWDLIQGDNK